MLLFAACHAGHTMTPQSPRLQMYDAPYSLYCAKVRVALMAKAATYESLPVPGGSTNSSEYHAVVPLAKLPALLVTEPGKPTVCLMESEVINEFLEERFPTSADHPAGTAPVRLLPTDPVQRAQARMVSRYHDLYYAPTLAKLYPHVDPAQRDDSAVAAVVEELQARTDQLLTLLSPEGPYACGTSLSLADCGFPAAFFYTDLILAAVCGHSLQWPSRVEQWRGALDKDTHAQAALGVLRPAAYNWMRSKLGKEWQPPAGC